MWLVLQQVTFLQEMSVCFQMDSVVAVQCVNRQGSFAVAGLGEDFPSGGLEVSGLVSGLPPRSQEYMGGCSFPSGGSLGPLEASSVSVPVIGGLLRAARHRSVRGSGVGSPASLLVEGSSFTGRRSGCIHGGLEPMGGQLICFLHRLCRSPPIMSVMLWAVLQLRTFRC